MTDYMPNDCGSGDDHHDLGGEAKAPRFKGLIHK